ncbi:hypothetical protein GLYMA_08G326300v4 [Glycine max]|uniref:ABC transporter C family member 3 isoform X2 n=1 Tax=Glycine max TaxID=3847 RepID=UPI001B35606C|nr:ABC transporter C family member 3-like isoform X2 [Glycine max]KAG4399912.1 hypothetical protein GLYMA_08G326300v4 [Glycine max]KAH1054214.1 hypothetical protein GYH30_023139 [Glycine max]
MLQGLENFVGGCMNRGCVLQIALALLILYRSVGVASIAALAATVTVMLLNLPVASLQEKFQGKVMEFKDKRMKTTSEILMNMRILKLQAWEMKFLSKIIQLRKTEEIWLKKFLGRSYLHLLQNSSNAYLWSSGHDFNDCTN